MKILLVSPFTSDSGSAIRFWNIAKQFKERGFDVVYIDRHQLGKKPLYQIEGVTYSYSPVFKPFVLDLFVSTIFNLFMLFKHLNCTIFYALKPAPNNCIAALAAKFLGKKILLDIDDLDYEYLHPGLKKSLSRFFFRFFPKYFPLITCHTPNLLAYCKNELRIADNHLYYLAQGVSREFLKLDLSKKPLVQRKSIVYVATLGITSDFDDLFPMLARICERHKDATISVIGDGVRLPAFKAAAKTLDLSKQMTFLGRIPHAELPEVMARHGIGLNYMRPSFGNNCRAILKLREYLACGLQVVCNNTGDAGLFSAFAFVEPDIVAMEKRLQDLLDNVPIVNSKGRAFIESHFSWNSILTDFLRTHGNFFTIRT
jgi:glycosyltransferase involved in cell wall biosynthesis